MRDFWRQARLPVLVVGTTLLAIGTVVGVVYGMYWASKNTETLGRYITGGAALAAMVGVAILYFLPFAVAIGRKHHNLAPIFIVNMFSGPIGFLMISPGIGVGIWAGALAWSASATPMPVVARRAPEKASA